MHRATSHATACAAIRIFTCVQFDSDTKLYGSATGYVVYVDVTGLLMRFRRGSGSKKVR